MTPRLQLQQGSMNESISLYQYMCTHIVGTEKYVKTIRMMNAVRDDVSSEDENICITSGSFGEGLEMRGSDIDIMYIDKSTEVHENITSSVYSPLKTYLSMASQETKPGFTILRLVKSNNPLIVSICKKSKMGLCLSNYLFKQLFTTRYSSVIHGPSVSDVAGCFDIVHCFSSKSWITPASQWITRSKNPWPTKTTKELIKDHGVLFVPTGVNGSPQEEFEWRISFSVGEKLLVYTFSHTQLLCYSLMKILVKDVIEKIEGCKKLLSSYYLKTIMFWISEETNPSIWRPENLIKCFMICLRRLIYFVQNSCCPHFFIPENNMFHNKIEGENRDVLLSALNGLFSYGWQCIFISDQIMRVHISPCTIKIDRRNLYYADVNKFLGSKVLNIHLLICGRESNYRRVVYRTIYSCSTKLQYIRTYYMSLMCNHFSQSIELNFGNNKNQYVQYKSGLNYLLMNFYHDAVSGYLMLASFFHRFKQFEYCFQIVQYALSKCTGEKLYPNTKLSDMQCNLINLDIFKKKGVVRMLKFLLLDSVQFTVKSTVFPRELPKQIVVDGISPEEYVIELYRLHVCPNNPDLWRDSLRVLQSITAERRGLTSSL